MLDVKQLCSIEPRENKAIPKLDRNETRLRGQCNLQLSQQTFMFVDIKSLVACMGLSLKQTMLRNQLE